MSSNGWRPAPAIGLMRPLTLLMLTVAAALALACDEESGTAGSGSTATLEPRPLPSPVAYRQDPDGITLADPAFEPLPGARAEFGRLGGAVYQIEMPDDWNGRLVLQMHGFENLGPEARATAPDFRRYLIGHGYAWAASSFSSTSSIPGRSADETAALWDYFARKYGRPAWTYVTGISMGGAASHIAAERYPERFDGALALCGSAGQSAGTSVLADYVAAGAYVAGVTQAEFDAAADRGALVGERVIPTLQNADAHRRFEDVMLDLTGGPRAFDREGFHAEEDTNWERAELLVTAGLAPNVDKTYTLGPNSSTPGDEFNRDVVRLRPNDALLPAFLDRNEVTGDVRIPLLTLHTTGDGQVPIEQARILRRRVDAAGKGDLLVQRVIRDPGHCGFTTAEQEAGFEALVAWVEGGARPDGDDVLLDDLRALEGKFELAPRPGTPAADAVPGAGDRATAHGVLTLDGSALDSNFVGAVVRKDGLFSPCQYTLRPADGGVYEIVVSAQAEVDGCGAPGTEIVLWTFARNMKLYSREALPWPADEAARFDASFSTAAPDGGDAVPASEFAGEVYDRRGERLPPGTRVEAYVGDTLCGVASVRRTGSFSGYILNVAGSDSVAGCARGATLTFRIDGRHALETAVNAPGGSGSLDLTLP
jgi:pimeloyl-ACP methyl ester carboxylesterase